MEEWEIGTVSGDDQYAGPKYGWVTRSEYNALLQKGSLGRGQQTFEIAGEHLLKSITSAYTKVGEYIPDVDLPEPNEKVKGALSTTANIARKAWEFSGLQTQVDQTMMLLNAPVKAVGWASRKLDPTGRGIGEAPLTAIETGLSLGGASLLKQGGKKLLQQTDNVAAAVFRNTDNLAYATANVTDQHLLRSTVTNEFTPNTVFFSKSSAVPAAKGVLNSPHLDKQGVLRKTFTDEADRRFNRVKYMNKNTIKTFKGKAGNQFKSLSNKLDEAYKHYEIDGSLKGLEGGTKWTNPETGQTFLIKNKAASSERVKLGIDSLESVAATKALREASATITLDDVIREAAGTGLSKELAIKYFNIAKSGKKDLTKLIYKLNKKAGRKLWSLGHGRAVKALRDAGSGHADMLSNIELEPLINVVDDFGNVLVRGNSGRGAVDELPDALNTALNRSRNLREELLKFSDKDLGDFWPKMGPITDEASFLTEAAKRDAFVEKVLEVSKSTKTVEEAVDLVLDAAGIMRTKGASTFPDASIYKNMKITF